MFDIRNYKTKAAENSDNLQEKGFWTHKFLRSIDSCFYKINEECAKLVEGMNNSTEEAFTKKINAWHELVIALQKLCRLYKITDAACLSKN